MADETMNLPPSLASTLQQMARKYKSRLWLRGLRRLGATLIVLAVLCAVAIAAALSSGYGPLIPIIGFIVAAIIAALVCLVPPATTRVSPEQIALYLDTHHPEFENRLISAVEFSNKPEERLSPWMVEEIIRETEEIALHSDFTEEFKAPFLARFSGPMLTAIGAVAALAVIVAGLQLERPAPAEGEEEQETSLSEIPFTVEPGDVRVRRGSNQVVWVKAADRNEKVGIRYRNRDGSWQAAAMPVSNTEDVNFHQFTDIREDMEYEVQVGHRRSETYNITVWTPPEVEAIHLTYTYPEYLGLEPKEVPNGGDISAIEGTVVEFEVDVNKRLEKAELALASGERVQLEEEGPSTWRGRIEIAEDDKYTVDLVDDDGEANEYKAEYKIAAKADEPPEIEINFPQGDTEATPIEEIPFTFSVSDDYGLKDYGIEYEVVGREPVRVPLKEEDGVQVSADGDTMILLENLNLEEGDFITWTVYAEDQKPDRDVFDTKGFPYFVEIRPFKRTFREAVSNQGGMPMGQQSATSQKEIIIATWNLRRDAHMMDEAEFDEKRNTIVESQKELLGQAQMMGGGEAAETIKLVEAMQAGNKLLKEAELPEPGQKLSEAMHQQQIAYRYILQLRPKEQQVMQQQSQSGGGGGQQSPDISSLELDRRKDFYEEASTVEQQQQAAAEALNKIKELAQRQKIINEDLAKLLSELKTATPEEEEEIRRRLERLKEEQQQNMEQLDELGGEMSSGEMDREQAQRAQGEMDDARRQMNRSMENMEDADSENLQRAQAAANRASNLLDDVKKHLDQLTSAGAAERLNELQEQMAELEQKQDEIIEKAEGLRQSEEEASFEGMQESDRQAEELMQEREELARQYREMMEEAGELAERSQASQELMSQKLNDWLRETAQEGIEEEIGRGEQLIEYGLWDSAVSQEQQVRDKLAEAGEKLDRVQEYLVEDELEGMQKALRELQDVLEQEGVELDDGQAPGEQEMAQGGTRPGREPGDEQQRGMGGEPGDKEQRGAGEGDDREQMAMAPGGDEGEQMEGPGEGERRAETFGESMEGEEEGPQGQRPGQQEGDESQRAGEQQGQEGDPSQQAVGQPGQQGQPSQRPGDQQGQEGQQGQMAERSGQQPGQQGQGEQPSDQQGWQEANQAGGNQPGSPSQPPRGNQQPQPGQMQGGPPQDFGTTHGGAFRGWGPRSEADLREFVEQDYREWQERLRNAESLLPEDSPLRDRIAEIQENIDLMRRSFKRDHLTPKYDLFLEKAGTPLIETAEDLRLEIDKILKDQEYALLDEGEIPSQYTEHVAEYFKALSESEER